MEVSIIFKIGAVGILVSVLSQILKHSGREEQAFLVSFSGLLLVLFWIVPYIYERPRTGVCKPCYDGNRSCDTGISGREDQLSVPVSGETETESSD